MAKQDDYVRYTIRVPREVFEPIEAAAHASGRSANSEIVERLKFSIRHSADDFSNLQEKIELMERDIEYFSEEFDNIKALYKDESDLIESLGNAVAANVELTKIQMHYILGYIDKIPSDLAIWAYYNCQILDRVGPSTVLQSVKGDALTVEEKAQALERRKRFLSKTVKDIRKYMEEKKVEKL